MSTIGTIAAQLKVTPGDYAKVSEVNAPRANNAGDTIIPGYSTVPQLARGFLQDTSIAVSNAEIFHICDPKNVVAIQIAALNSTIADAIQTARNAIVDTILSDALLGPTYTIVKDLIRDALAALKYVNKVLYKINKTIQEANNFISYANGLINLIKTLPTKIAQTLTQCLALLQTALKTALTVNLGDIGGIIQQTQLAISQTQSAISSTKTTVTNLNSTVSNIASLPSSLSTNLSQASKTLSTSITSFSKTSSSLVSVYVTGPGNSNPFSYYGKP